MPPQIPYLWLLGILFYAAATFILLAPVLVVISFVTRWFPKRRLRLAGLASFLLGLILVASGIAFRDLVQLPSYARQIEQRIQDRNDAASLVKLGDRVPAFHIKSADGTEFAIDRLRGKVVLLSFFATWCGPCLDELPHVQEIWDAYRERTDFTMLVIGREETDQAVTAFKMKQGYSFPVGADPNRAVYSLFAKELIPRLYLISRDGTVCFAEMGYHVERLDELQQELAKQLPAAR